jgi:hypothetical protein
MFQIKFQYTKLSCLSAFKFQTCSSRIYGCKLFSVKYKTAYGFSEYYIDTFINAIVFSQW